MSSPPTFHPQSYAPGPVIPRRSPDAPAPQSFGQELLWLMDRASPGLTAWNVPRAYRIRGPLDVDALGRALTALAERHETLRTVFEGAEGAAQQRVLPPAPVELARVDLQGESAEERERRLSELLYAEAHAPFDLTRERLLRATLVQLAAEEAVLALTTHHIVHDGWSKGVMLRELSALYAAFRDGAVPDLPPLAIQFADFATWERDPVQEAALAEPLSYWRRQLGGTLPDLALPTDFPRGQAPAFEGGVVVRILPRDLATAIQNLARNEGATVYMVLLAAYAALLHRYTGQTDLTVGSPIAGRFEPETEALIGYFANTLVLRNDVSGDPTFAELLARVRDVALDAYEHQNVPLEKLVLELQSGQRLTHAPLFRVVLTMEDTIPASFELAGTSTEPVDVGFEATKFDLTLLFSLRPEGLRLSLGYRRDLFLQSSASRFLSHFATLLASAVVDPSRRVSELALMSADELHALRGAWEASSFALDSSPVPARIEAAATRTPSATAVSDGVRSLSYDELVRDARRLARHLGTVGVGRGARVALVMERSVDAVVAMLGIMMSGAAYVPVDPALPRARVAQVLTEASASVVVTRDAFRAALPEASAVVSVDGDAAVIAAASAEPLGTDLAADVAYVLFTSGSTGTPKGVMITHGNLANYVSGIIARFGWESEAAPLRFAMVSTLAADLGNTVLYPALALGGELFVVPAEVATDATRFGELAARVGFDVLKITPNHLRALATGPAGDAVLPRRWLVLGGEALSFELAERVLRAGRCRLANHYGPTEATVGCAAIEVTAETLAAARAAGAQTVPIGTAIPNARLHVVDARGTPVPAGVHGELWVGGAGVAAGYVGRSDLTAERFVPDPFVEGGRVYRTGDRVRRLATGEIEFLGRVDDQVKIRGHRVELGEIEQALRHHPGVADAAVVLHAAAADGDAALVGYIVPRSTGYAAAHAVRATPDGVVGWMRERLPEYMVPGAIIALDALPLSPNGKLDRAALPSGTKTADDGYVAPATDTERTLAQIWSEILKRDRIGTQDSFVTLGGHSLLAIRVLGRISKQLGVRLPLRTLFETPTIAALSAVIDAELRARDEAALLEALAAVEGLSDADAQRALDERPGDDR